MVLLTLNANGFSAEVLRLSGGLRLHIPTALASFFLSLPAPDTPLLSHPFLWFMNFLLHERCCSPTSPDMCCLRSAPWSSLLLPVKHKRSGHRNIACLWHGRWDRKPKPRVGVKRGVLMMLLLF